MLFYVGALQWVVMKVRLEKLQDAIICKILGIPLLFHINNLFTLNDVGEYDTMKILNSSLIIDGLDVKYDCWHNSYRIFECCR